MAHLFTNSSGYEVKSHSYSAGDTFDSCPRKYLHRRVEGWKTPDNKASLHFGIAVEAGLIRFHNTGCVPNSGVEDFMLLWRKVADIKDVEYTAKEGDWMALCKMGIGMIRLYEATWRKYPIRNPVFQANHRKQVFEEAPDLQFNAYLDVFSTLDEDHELLPAGVRQLIVDIKTAGAPYSTIPGIAKMDGQLRSYAFAKDIPDVAFMVFVKANPSLERGDNVRTLVEIPFEAEPGDTLTVLSTDKDHVILGRKEDYERLVSREKQISGTGSVARKAALQAEFTAKGLRVLAGDVTKCYIQFLHGQVSEKERAEVKQQVARQMTEIKSCNESESWPQKPGMRWPHATCLECECLGLCMGDPKLVAERLIAPGDIKKAA